VKAALIGIALILETLSPIQAQQPWRLIPEVRIGSEESEEYALTRVGAVAIGPDGLLVVADRGDRRLRVFDEQGKFVRWVGGVGNGPGEFTAMPGHVAIRRDTLEVVQGNRLHLFLTDGQLVRTTPIHVDLATYYRVSTILARTPDGDLLGLPALRNDALISGRETRSPLVRVDESGRVLGTATYVDYSKDIVAVRTPSRTFGVARPFGAELIQVGPNGDRIVRIDQHVSEAGKPDAFTVIVLGPEGDTMTVGAVRYQPLRIAKAVRDSIAEALLRDPQPGRPMPAEERRAIREQVSVPEYYPPVSDLLIGYDGRIWLRRYVAEGTEWLILDPECRPLGVVQGGPTLRIHAATATEVWASELNSLDVPTLLRMRIATGERERGSSNEGTIR
jgi:hypothetical protein